jgi:hypothetical protein
MPLVGASDCLYDYCASGPLEIEAQLTRRLFPGLQVLGLEISSCKQTHQNLHSRGPPQSHERDQGRSKMYP